MERNSGKQDVYYGYFLCILLLNDKRVISKERKIVRACKLIRAQKRPRNGSKWSTEYHICHYVSKCSSGSVVFKSSVCHLGKPCINPVFKMAPKTVAS